MKKNVLMLTSIYPALDSKLMNTTSVCHYFAKEWVKQGYNVLVIFNYPIYGKVLHGVARLFEKKIANKYATYVSTVRYDKDSFYELDGVQIARFPLYKMIPKIRYSYKEITKQTNKIVTYLEKESFQPDYIVGHFHTPSLELITNLKQKYDNAVSCVVTHGEADNLISFYGEKAHEMVNNIDIWGYRSRNIKEKFEKLYGQQTNSFICYSGIPKEFIPQRIEFRNQVRHFIYVGSLIHRKYPSVIIPALLKSFPDKNFKLTLIGEGTEKKKLIKQIEDYKLHEHVNVLGHIPRRKVSNYLETADCFIMVSEKESFGLVYLEAMAKGCVTIASRDEGMDGVIKEGENGFLCEAGNINQLAKLISKINQLSDKEIEIISENALKTAKEMTDKQVAEQYIANFKLNE